MSKSELDQKSSNLSLAQKISLTIVLLMISMVVFATISQISGHELLAPISLITSVGDLIKVDTGKNRVSAVDFAKLLFCVQAIVVHSSVCLVTVMAPYVINRLNDIERHIGDLWMQPLINVTVAITAAAIR